MASESPISSGAPNNAQEATTHMIVADLMPLKSHYHTRVWNDLRVQVAKSGAQWWNCAETPLDGYQNFKNQQLAQLAKDRGFFNVSTHHDTLRVCWRFPDANSVKAE